MTIKPITGLILLSLSRCDVVTHIIKSADFRNVSVILPIQKHRTLNPCQTNMQNRVCNCKVSNYVFIFLLRCFFSIISKIFCVKISWWLMRSFCFMLHSNITKDDDDNVDNDKILVHTYMLHAYTGPKLSQ